ncbi:hypothetical protein Tco_1224476, partial [Tanacetum coccineum]
ISSFMCLHLILELSDDEEGLGTDLGGTFDPEERTRFHRVLFDDKGPYFILTQSCIVLINHVLVKWFVQNGKDADHSSSVNLLNLNSNHQTAVTNGSNVGYINPDVKF